MNVVYSSSDSYAEICGISITSLLENNKDVENIQIFVIDNNIGQENKERLLQTSRRYPNSHLVFVNKVDVDALTKTKVYTGRWNIGTFFRLYLSSILPKSIERVMYIDCDMIVRHSLKSIYEMDLGQCSVGAVDDCRSDLYRIEIGCKPNTPYVNNGFMLIDLKKWREEGTEEKFTKFITANNGDCTYMDQAPLNGVLGPLNEILELPPIYNAQTIFFDFDYDTLLRLRKPNHHLSKKEYDDAVRDPVIVHFTPVFISGTRPWQIKDKHKFTNEYRHYKSISEWKDVPYRKDDRKLRKKLMTLICRATPKCIMVPIMSYLHSTWYPKKRMKKHSLEKENTRA